jgi:hypothetical protein
VRKRRRKRRKRGGSWGLTENDHQDISPLVPYDLIWRITKSPPAERQGITHIPKYGDEKWVSTTDEGRSSNRTD